MYFLNTEYNQSDFSSFYSLYPSSVAAQIGLCLTSYRFSNDKADHTVSNLIYCTECRLLFISALIILNTEKLAASDRGKNKLNSHSKFVSLRYRASV